MMQIILALVNRAANSISEMIGVPCCWSLTINGAVSGIPGDLITSSALRMRDSVCCPSSQGILCWLSKARYGSLIVPISETKTSKPFSFAKIAAPLPLSPAPKITILFIVS